MAEESFEALYRRLEATVARLEAGGLGLEEGQALYEEGMALARRLKEMLAAAELRIARLGEEGGLREEGPLWEEGWPEGHPTKSAISWGPPEAPPTGPRQGESPPATATGHARIEGEELDQG